MRKWIAAVIALSSCLSIAGEKATYQDWSADMGGQTNEAYTIADAKSSLGVYCANDQCLFYLRQGLNCTPGAKYSVLMNSSSISSSLSMECTSINGNMFQILTPFNQVLQAIQTGDSIGFAVGLQSGAFAVSRFSLLGAKLAVDRVLNEAAISKKMAQGGVLKLSQPQILIVPPTQILAQAPRNSMPNPSQRSGSRDISI